MPRCLCEISVFVTRVQHGLNQWAFQYLLQALIPIWFVSYLGQSPHIVHWVTRTWEGDVVLMRRLASCHPSLHLWHPLDGSCRYFFSIQLSYTQTNDKTGTHERECGNRKTHHQLESHIGEHFDLKNYKWRMTLRQTTGLGRPELQQSGFLSFVSRCIMRRTPPCYMGVPLNNGTPPNTPKWSFLVGKPMVVGYHHFRK